MKAMMKFDGKNFQLWKSQIKAVLTANGILDIADGTKREPQGQAGQDQWKRDNTKAMFIISSALEDSQLECLLTCLSASEMWTKLITTHERTSSTNKLQLMQKFYEYHGSCFDNATTHHPH